MRRLCAWSTISREWAVVHAVPADGGRAACGIGRWLIRFTDIDFADADHAGFRRCAACVATLETIDPLTALASVQ